MRAIVNGVSEAAMIEEWGQVTQPESTKAIADEIVTYLASREVDARTRLHSTVTPQAAAVLDAMAESGGLHLYTDVPHGARWDDIERHLCKWRPGLNRSAMYAGAVTAQRDKRITTEPVQDLAAWFRAGRLKRKPLHFRKVEQINDSSIYSPSKVRSRVHREAKSEKRKWTQKALDAELSKFFRDNKRQISSFKDGIERGEKNAKSKARELIGRNNLAERFQCPSAMVSKSPAWKTLAEKLHLLGRSPGIGRCERVGLDIAAEQSSVQDWRVLEQEQKADDANDERMARTHEKRRIPQS